MPHLTVASHEEKLTVLEFLRRRIPTAPPAYLRQLLKKGKIRSAAAPLAAGEVLAAGDLVQLPASRLLEEMLAQPARPPHGVEILFESREILVVNKGAGLAVHAAGGQEEDNLTQRVRELSRGRGERFLVAPIHRLDLGTSGPVLFGKGREACGQLGRMFMAGGVEKRYLALAAGRLDGQGTLSGMVPAKGKEKAAATGFRALAGNDFTTLLELRLLTGRRHQIRRQLAEYGHPLFGDRRYGGPCPPALQRLFLHCRHLAFVDPFTSLPLTVAAPLPVELARFAASLRLRPAA
jgi:RluA family pseudouridine synthase